MPLAWSSPSADQTDSVAAGSVNSVVLSKLVYRSRVVQPLSSLELYRLALAAQSRNRAESVTGLLLYDEGRFFQWLEGPAESLARLMRSIHSDSRHADIEILDNRLADGRAFADWSMKLAATGNAAASRRRDVMEPPPGIIAALRRTPQAAPILLANLMPRTSAPLPTMVTELRSSPRGSFNPHAAAVLRSVFIDTVIPELRDRRGLPPVGARPPAMHKRVAELAELLIGADQAAARELIREVQAEYAPTLLQYATLFEPAARRLGDLWSEDLCSEFDVALGMSRMQTAVRLLSPDGMGRRAAALSVPQVLIAPEPGELHGLGAALDSEVMWNVGWNPQCEYPRDDHALEDLVAASWFDVLDLSLSAAFHRQHWLPRLRKTVAAARQASLNPALVVVVGGRMFAEHLAVGAQVGADSASTTAVEVDQAISEWFLKGSAPVLRRP